MDFPEETPPGLLANVAPGDNSPALSVSELSGALKRTIENAFGQVRVRGEISGFKRHASGHCYFALKDENACIDAVIWRTSTGALAFRPEDGAEVIATGRLTTYPGRSKYQIVVDRMELAGEGALLALLEKRRKALAAEGLFAPERKRKLPFLPRVIGVVTSPTGAVIRDILHRLEDRCPTRVILWPVPVQGEGAAAKIASAIRAFPSIEPRPDLLIVARGGGSIEDLWPFNEEEVVRAAGDSPIPLISAVGHETDTTLIDHAADLRAPTPTAAAELAVPVRSELFAQLAELQHRAQQCLSRRIERGRERFELTICRWPEPQTIFTPVLQRLDEVGERLPRSLAARAGTARADLNLVAGRLRRDLIDQRMARLSEQVGGLWRLAELAHPDKPLARGFARVTSRDGRTLTSAADARAAARLTLHFGDGLVDASVD
jgi:exodeoxyribonuclease VII large subunit